MKIRFFWIAAAIVVSSFSHGAVYAADSALGSCMTDSMTGKERKEVAQWIFFAIAAHPDIKEYSKVSEPVKRSSDEHVASLVTRLLTEDCVAQAKSAYKKDGQAAIVGAFEVVGRVAMQELMINQDVSSSIGSYAKYLDREKLAKIFSK